MADVTYRGYSTGNGGSNFTFPKTCDALSNHLFVWITFGDETDWVCSSVTYNSVLLTKLAQNVITSPNYCALQLWGLAFPPTGSSYNVQVNGTFDQAYAVAEDWSEVSPGKPLGNIAYATDATTPFTNSVDVTSPRNAAFDGLTPWAYGDPWANGGSQTTVAIVGGSWYRWLCTGRYAAGSGTKTFTWTSTGDRQTVSIAAEIRARVPGSQIILMQFERLLRDLREGLIPANQMKRRLEEAWSI